MGGAKAREGNQRAATSQMAKDYSSGSSSVFEDDFTNTKRAEQSYKKLRGSTFWVLTGQAAGKLIWENFGPDPRDRPFYIPIGNEVKVLKDLIQDGVPVVLTGPPGIGKTTMIETVFHELNIPMQTFVSSASTQASELLGQLGTGGERGDLSVWTDGKLSLAARAAEGGVINGIYLDEVINLPANVASVLYSVLDNRQSLPLPTGEELKVGRELKCVFSYNPSRTVKLEDALRSRLTAIRINYAPEAVEARLLMDKRRGCLERLAAGQQVALGLTKFANTLRACFGYEVDGAQHALSEAEQETIRTVPAPPSTRSLIVAARMIAMGSYEPCDAVNTFVIPSMTQDTHDYQLPRVLALLREIAAACMPVGILPDPRPASGTNRLATAIEEYDVLKEREREAAAARQQEEEDPLLGLHDSLETKALAEEILREWRQKNAAGS